jgi:hypothetical protein
MRDERLTGAALLPLVRRGREAEGAGDELDVDVRALGGGDLRKQPLEELFVSLACLQSGHQLSVLPGFWANPRGRNGR